MLRNRSEAINELHFGRYFSWHSPQAPSLSPQAATPTGDHRSEVVADTDRLLTRQEVLRSEDLPSAAATRREVEEATRREVEVATLQEVIASSVIVISQLNFSIN